MAESEPSEEPSAEPSPATLGGFLAFDGYYDSRDRSMLTMRALALFPGGVEYFGLVNLFTFTDATDNLDLSAYYTEQNLLWKLGDLPLGLNVQWVSAFGEDNDLARGGVRWEPSATSALKPFFDKLHLWYIVYFHLIQSDGIDDGYKWQIEHAYKLDILPKQLDGRAYLYGFLDHDMDFSEAGKGNRHTLVFEHQLNFRLVKALYLMAQVRHEEFLPDQTGYGAGVEYVISFF